MVDDQDWLAPPDDLVWSLTWELDADGRLRGPLKALNVSDRALRLRGKPELRPLGVDGQALDTRCPQTLELRHPAFAEIAPGQCAVCPVGWAGWDGPPASGRVEVTWPGGRSEIAVVGPAQPTSTGPATNLSTSWFTTITDTT